ncbi:MAG TPA: hypothetical protein VI752_00560 [Candidatus Paceibacterota bacterium]|nr:hypothetical protein [Patescibacteria group bacterium]
MGTKTKNSPNTLTWEEVMALDLKGHSLEAKEDGVACSGPIKEVKFGPEEKIIFCLEWIEFEGKAKVLDYKYCVSTDQQPIQTGQVISVVVTGVTPTIPISISLV